MFDELDKQVCENCGIDLDFDDEKDTDSKCWCHKCRCHLLGIKIAKSAVDVENAIAKSLCCECKIIQRILCGECDRKLLCVMKLFNEHLENVCCIEKQVVEKLKKGLEITKCDGKR